MNHLPKKFLQVAEIIMKQSKSSDADFVKFDIAEKAFFIKCFTVTDVSQSTDYFY